MANLFSRTGATRHEDPDYGAFEPDASGAFAFPDDLSDQLLRFHVRGRRLWEDEPMRAERLHSEELARQRDPAALYGVMAGLGEMLKGSAQPAPVPDAALAEALKQTLAELASLRAEVAELRAGQTPEPPLAPLPPDPALIDAEPDTKTPSKRRTSARSGAPATE